MIFTTNNKTHTAMSQPKAIDLLGYALENNYSIDKALNVLDVGDQIILQDKEAYSNYVENPENPNSLNAKEFDIAYAKAKALKNVYDKGFEYRMTDPSWIYTEKALNIYTPGRIAEGSHVSHTPLTFSSINNGPGRVMSDNQYAYSLSEYAVPDPKLVDGYRYEKKKPGWEFEGKYVFHPDPRNGGESSILVQLDRGDDSFGYEQLSTFFGMPSDYSTNVIINSFKNIIDAGARFGKSAANVVAGLSNIATDDMAIFNEDEDYTKYIQKLMMYISGNKMHEKRLKDALEKNDKAELLDLFNYLEHTMDIGRRNQLKEMRHPERWVQRNRAMNNIIGYFEGLEHNKSEFYKNTSALEDWRSLIYNTSQVVGDLAIQLGAGVITGGSMAAFTGIGTIQAVGSFYESMRDAGFDDRTIGVAMAAALPMVAASEYVVGKMWAFKSLDNQFAGELKREIKQTVNQTLKDYGGKVTTEGAVKLGKDMGKKFLSSKAFKNATTKPAVAKLVDVGKAVGLEVPQETFEDMGYNFINWVVEKMKPEYYGEDITTGITEVYGKQGIINPEQMLETAVLTALATGFNDGIRKINDPYYKRENLEKVRDIQRSGWVADQFIDGNIGVFTKMAAEESKKENGAFGPKNMKLSEMGIEPIVVSAEEAVRYKDYSIGTAQPDGSLLIDNVADMNIKDFVDEVETIGLVMQRHKLDNARDLNNIMLRQIYDANGKLMASNALKNAVAYDKAQEAYEAKKASMSVEGYELNDADKKELDTLESNVKRTKAALDYYIKHEAGTSYSEAINDSMKSMLTSYDQAVALARRDLGADFDKDVKKGDLKRVKAVVDHYNKLLQTSEHYLHLKKTYDLMNSFRDNIEQQRAAKLEELNGYYSGEKPYDGSKTIEAYEKASEVLERYLANQKINGQEASSILEELNLEDVMSVQQDIARINPTEMNPVIERFSGLFDRAKANLSNLVAINEANTAFYKSLEEGQGNNPFIANIIQAINDADASIDGKLPELNSINGYAEWAGNADKNAVKEVEKLYNRYRAFNNENRYDEIASLNKLNNAKVSTSPVYNEEAEYKFKLAEEIASLSTGKTITDAYNLLIEETQKQLDESLAYVTAIKDGVDPYTLEQRNIQEDKNIIDSYMSIINELKTAKVISERLHGQDNFNKHSSADEQEFVENMATGSIGEGFNSTLSNIEEKYDEFKRKSGLDALSSARKSILTGMLIHAHQAKTLLWMESLGLEIGTFITAEQKEALTRLVVTEEIMKNEGELTDAERKIFDNGRKAIVDVMTVLHKHKDKLFGNSKNSDKLYEPIRLLAENIAKTSTSDEIRLPLSFNSHDGKFTSVRLKEENHATKKMEPKIVSDVNELRYVSSQLTPIEATQSADNKVKMEAIVHYVNLLVQLDGALSAQQIMSKRKLLYDPLKNYNVDVSTYEQEVVEDSIIAFESGSRVLSQIEAFSYKAIAANNKKPLSSTAMIPNAIIIPGDYGTGKTKQVIYNALKILELSKAHKGGAVYFFSPSEKLRNDMQKLFNPDGKKVDKFNITSKIETLDGLDLTKNQTWIVDEGSLLTEKTRQALVDASQKSKGKLRIIIMADMNQMRPKNDKGGYPSIMERAPKTAMLSEQWSTASQMIKKHTDFWKRQINTNRAMNSTISIISLPMTYHKEVDGVLKGVQYFSSSNDVYTAFNASKNESKALVFYDINDLKAFSANNPGMQDIINKGMAFVLLPDGADERHIIQGLRAEEVYIMTYYGDMKEIGMSRASTAMYTAIGRSSGYVGINMSDQAKTYTETDPLKMSATSVGDEASTIRILNEKRENLRKEIARNQEFVLGDEYIKPSISEKPEMPDDRDELITTTGSIVINDGQNNINLSYHTTRVQEEDEYDEYLFKLNGTDIGLTSLRVNATMQEISDAATRLYADYTNQKAPKTKVKEVATPYDDPILGKTYGTDPDINAMDNPETPEQVRKSQAIAWEKGSGLYGTTYNVIVPDGVDHKTMNLREVRAMHAFLIQERERLGLTLSLKYLRKGNAINKDGNMQTYDDMLLIRAQTESYKALKSRINVIKLNDLKDGSVKNVIRRLKAIKNIDEFQKAFNAYTYVSALALPTQRPVLGKESPMTISTAGGRDIDEQTIIDGYAAYDGPEKAMVINQRNAQIAISRLRNRGREMHDSSQNNEITIGNVENISSSRSRVEYGNTLKPLDDVLENGDVTIDISRGLTVYDDKGRFMVYVTHSPYKDAKSSGERVTVYASKLDPNKVANQKSEDLDAINTISDYDKPLSGDPVVKRIYGSAMELFISTYAYQILLNNRNIIKTKLPEYSDYVEFSGKYVNPVGSTLKEQKDNLETIINLIYGDWAKYLHTPIIIKNNIPQLGPTSSYNTYAKHVGYPHYYFTIEGVSSSETNVESESKSNRKKRARPQESSADAFDTDFTTEKESSKALKRMLGGHFASDMLDIHEGMISIDGMRATGLMKDGRIMLASFAGRVRMSTPYHETFHVVWNYLLDPEAKVRYEQEAKEKAYEMTGKRLEGIDLEEWMAGDGFAKYAIARDKANKKPTLFQRFMTWLKDLVGFAHKNAKTLEGLYDDIYTGRYAKKATQATFGTSETFFEEAEDVEEEYEETDDELYEEKQDRIDRYNTLVQSLPTMRDNVIRAVDITTMALHAYSPLSNDPAFGTETINEAIDRVRKESKEIEDEYGSMPIVVKRGGVDVETTIKDVKPEEVDNIYDKTISGSTEEQRKEAQANYRMWYLNRKDNIDTILEHMMPTWNAKNNTFGRGKVVRDAFDWTNADPMNDGLNAAIRLQLKMIPAMKVSKVNGKTVHSYNMEDMRMVDERVMNQVMKDVGTVASKIYDGRKIDDGFSRLDAFKEAIEEVMKTYGRQLNDDGTYRSRYTEALAAFNAKFFSGSDSYFIDEFNDGKMYSLYDLASKHLNGERKLDEKRVQGIINFLVALANVNSSYIKNNNSKVTVKGNEKIGFTYTFTEYGNNIYESTRQRIKDELNTKLTDGLFIDRNKIKRFHDRIHVSDKGNISIGGGRMDTERAIKFISIEKDKYVFNVGNRFVTSGTMLTKQEVDEIIAHIHEIQNVLGLGNKVITDNVLRQFIEAQSWDELKGAHTASLSGGIQGEMTPREFIAAFLANTIYSYHAQNSVSKVSIAIGGKKYEKHASLTDHVLEVEAFLESLDHDDRKNQIYLNNNAVTLDELKEGIVKAASPLSEKVNDYVKKLGVQGIYNSYSSIDGESMTSMGYPFPIPSQFYTAINAIAHEAASQAGLATGVQVFRADGKPQHVLQQKNKFNEMIDGAGQQIKVIANSIGEMKRVGFNDYLSVSKEAKKVSPFVSSSGEVLSPYLLNLVEGKESENGMHLKHIQDMYGMRRDYGGFTRGTDDLTTTDMMIMGIQAFLSNLTKSSYRYQRITTPIMTIADTGRIYHMTHQMNGKAMFYLSGKGRNKMILINEDVILKQLELIAKKVDRRVQLSYDGFIGLISELNDKFGSDGFMIALPIKGNLKQTRTPSRAGFISNVDKQIAAALNAVSADVRQKIIDYVQQSNLDKTSVVKLIGNDGFGIGHTAADAIPNKSAGESIYNSSNRKAIIKAANDSKMSKEQKYKLIVDLFLNDYKATAKYMEQHNVTDSQHLKDILALGTTSQPFSGKTVNDGLFAYYLAFHITNEAFSDINGGVADYRDLYDRVKRTGVLNTPTINLSTDVTIDGNNVGSLPKKGYAITINDVEYKTILDGKNEEVMKRGTDGQSFISGLWRKFYDMSAGGRDYSVTGNGSMIKTLYIHRDPLRGGVSIIKHAGKFITQDDFMNNRAYYNMQMDMLASQDNHLPEGFSEREDLIGTELENFSWLDTFESLLDKGLTFDEAMNEMHQLVIRSQEYGEDVYNALVESICYGFNTENTRKAGLKAINRYNPLDNTGNRYPEGGLVSEDLYYDSMGIILSAEQPLDDSKPQAPFAQQEAFFGVSGATLTGELQQKWGDNPGVAISKIKKKMYDIASKQLSERIGKTNLPVEVSGLDFSSIDWSRDDLEQHYGDKLNRAVAQYDWYVRTNTRRSLDLSRVPGQFVEMLGKNGVTSQAPQLRTRLIQNIRKEINKNLLKQGFKGMRVVQATGMFHQLYYLEGDSMAFTREDAIKHVYGDKAPIGVERFSQAVEDKLLETFTVRGLRDMSVQDGKTVPGQIIMPYIYAEKFGLKEGQSLRDLFTLYIGGKAVNIRNMSKGELIGLIEDNGINEAFFTSVLAQKYYKEYGYEGTDDILLDMAVKIHEYVQAANETLTTYANRVPSNRLGSGAIMEVAAIHWGGNEAFIPNGMAIMNDSDFDIDQLATYFKDLSASGILNDSEISKLQSEIMDVVKDVYMNQGTDKNLFLESGINHIRNVADEGKENETYTDNTLASMYKTYNDNRAGAEAIGILANTLSAVSWLQSIGDNLEGSIMDDNIRSIISDRKVKGRNSTVVRLGDWLQAALDNNKYNILGRFGVTPEVVNILGVYVAVGPKAGQDMNDFLHEIKDFFNDPVLSRLINQASMGESVHYSKKDNKLYDLVVSTIEKINSKNYRDNKVSVQKAKDDLYVYVKDLIFKYNEFAEENDMEQLSPDDYGVDQYIRSGLIYKTYASGDKEVEEYKKLRETLYLATEELEDKEALPKLEKMKSLMITGDALRSLSDIITLRNGIPGNDNKFDYSRKNIELALGMSVAKFGHSGRSLTNDKNNFDRVLDYAKNNDNEILEYEVDSVEYKRYVEHLKGRFEAFDLYKVIRSIPMLEVYLEQMARDINIHGGLFLYDNPNTLSLAKEFLDKVRKNDFPYSNNKALFNKAITMVVLDQWFASLSKKRRIVYMAAPIGQNMQLGYDNLSPYKRLDMAKVEDRQKLSLQMSNFITFFDEEFISREQMEMYFEKMVPPGDRNIYEGISNAFYDADNNFVGNKFINMLRSIGRGERLYVGLMSDTAGMTEQERLKLKSEFARLPISIQDIFRYNEMIVNTLNYHKGSISDIMGLDAFKYGLNDIYESVTESFRRGEHQVLTDDNIKNSFFDFLALKIDATPYVKNKMKNVLTDPFYITTFVNEDNQRYGRKVTFKQNASGTAFEQISMIYNRAGFSAFNNSVSTNMDVISVPADGAEQIYKGEPYIKTTVEQHNYKNGFYMLDNGMVVKLTTMTNNSVKLEKVEDDDIEAARKAAYDVIDQRGNNTVIVSVNSGEGGSMIAPPNAEARFAALSIYAERPFTLKGGRIVGYNDDMTFNSINEAMIWFRVSLMKRFSNNSEIQKLKLDENITDRVHAYNKMNKLLDIIISKNKDKDMATAVMRTKNNLSNLAKYIVSVSILSPIDAFKYDKDIVSSHLAMRKGTNETLNRFFPERGEESLTHFILNSGKNVDDFYNRENPILLVDDIKPTTTVSKEDLEYIASGYMKSSDMTDEDIAFLNSIMSSEADDASLQNEEEKNNKQC